MEYEITIDFSTGDVSVKECYDYDDGSPSGPVYINPLRIVLIILMVISIGGIISSPLPYIMAWDSFTDPLLMLLTFTLPIVLVSAFMLVFAILFMKAINDVEHPFKDLEDTANASDESGDILASTKNNGVEINGNIDFDTFDWDAVTLEQTGGNQELYDAITAARETERRIRETSGEEETDHTVNTNIIAAEYMTRKFAPFFKVVRFIPILLYVFLGLSILSCNILGLTGENLIVIVPFNLVAFIPVLVSCVVNYHKYMKFIYSRGTVLARVILIPILCLFFVPGIALLLKPVFDLGNSVMLLAFCVADLVFRIDTTMVKNRALKELQGKNYVPRFFLWRSLILFVALGLILLLVVCVIAMVHPDIYDAMYALDYTGGTDEDLLLVTSYFVGGAIVSLAIITVAELIANNIWHKSEFQRVNNRRN